MNEIANKTVLISGGAGAMGQLISEYINTREDFKISGIHDPNYEGDDYKIYNELTDIKEDLVIEFSPSSVVNENVEKLLKSDADIIIGSSGLTEELLSNLKNSAKNRKIIVIPNLSVGAAYQKLFSYSLSEKFILYESALIFETGSYKLNDFNILVTCDHDLRVKRIIKRDGINEEKINLIINNQWDDDKKIPLADYIFFNSTSKENKLKVKNLVTYFNSIFK